MRILKYTLEITSLQVLRIPEGSEFLSIQLQNGTPVMWVRATDKTERNFVIECYGTGHEVPMYHRSYLATIQVGGFGGFVWHFFRKNN